MLSGDVEDFLKKSEMLEAFSFREEEESEDTDEEIVVGVPPSASASPPGGNGDGCRMVDGRAQAEGPDQAGVERDGRRRRLAVLENCLDAFERFGLYSRQDALHDRG